MLFAFVALPAIIWTVSKPSGSPKRSSDSGLVCIAFVLIAATIRITVIIITITTSIFCSYCWQEPLLFWLFCRGGGGGGGGGGVVAAGLSSLM